MAEQEGGWSGGSPWTFSSLVQDVPFHAMAGYYTDSSIDDPWYGTNVEVDGITPTSA